MDSNLQNKWVFSTFLLFSILVIWVLWLGFLKFAGVFGLESTIPHFELWARGLSIGLGLGLFLYLIKSDTTNQFMHEVVAELYRVTWPTHKETMSATYVVVIMVLLSGVVLGLLDKFWTLVIKQVL